MKLALIQCDVCADPYANAEKLASFCSRARDADLCIAPAEALSGPASDSCRGDLLALLSGLAARLEPGAPLLCALPGRGAFLLMNGRVKSVDGVFTLANSRIGLDEFFPEGQVDLIVNLRSQRFFPDEPEERELTLSAQAARGRAPAVSVNICGGYGGDIYSGQSIAVNRDGLLIARASAFQEDLLRVDTDGPGTLAPPCGSLEEAQWRALTLGLEDYVHKAGARKVLIGLSGGMDSALVSAIACAALGPENVTGLVMPSRYTSAESVSDASQLAENLGLATFTIPIEPMFAAFSQSLYGAFEAFPPLPEDLTYENLQARIRGVILMACSNRSGALVLNTGNKSEAAMGYSTLYGDTVGAVAVIGDLFKTQVYALAKWRNEQAGKMLIPAAIFEKAPTAELRPGQKDTDSLPPYAELDPALERLLKGDCADEKLLARVRGSAFKRRQCPPPLLVSAHPLSQLCQGS